MWVREGDAGPLFFFSGKEMTERDLPRCKTVLDNGLIVVTRRMSHVRSVCVGLSVPAGSRHESRRTNGVSHFVEHMLFKGTERRSAREIASEVDAVGGEINAFTSREYTTYYIKVLDEYLERAVDILADLFLHSRFDRAELEKEREVILEEIRMQEDQPEEQVHDLIQEVIWPDNALGYPVAGRAETVAVLDRDDLLDHVRGAYLRPGVVLSCAGNVEHEHCAALAAERFREFAVRGRGPAAVQARYRPGRRVVTKELEQVHLCLSVPGLPQGHPDRYAFHLLNTILGANMSSRLFQEVREARGLAYAVYSYVSSFRDAGSLTVYTASAPAKIGEIVRVIRDELARLASEPVSEEELDKAKAYVKGGLLLSQESSFSVMSRTAREEIYFGREEPLDEILQGIREVTPRRVLDCGRRALREELFSLASIGPVGEEDLR